MNTRSRSSDLDHMLRISGGKPMVMAPHDGGGRYVASLITHVPDSRRKK